jgi:hypothetical protein
MNGINFIEPLHHKVVRGEKTRTGRIINPQPTEDIFPAIQMMDDSWVAVHPKEQEYHYAKRTGVFVDEDSDRMWRSRYRPGETVYLKEPYKIIHIQGKYIVTFRYSRTTIDLPDSVTRDEILRVQNLMRKSKTHYCNKLFTIQGLHQHMPHYIKITNVRAERLQEISDADCLKEGINKRLMEKHCDNPIMQNSLYYAYDSFASLWIRDTPQKSYADLIDKISGKGTWESNPYVFVYDFKLTEKPIL